MPTNCWKIDSPEADPDDAVDAARRLAQIAPRRLVLAFQRLPDPRDGDLQVLLSEQHAQYPACLRDLVGGNEIARRLGDGERERAVQQRGQCHGQEHPPPRVDAEPQGLVGPARRPLQQPVDDERQEDAGHDGQLLERSEPAADARRGGLGDVGRRNHRRDAHAEAADDPEQHDGPHFVGETGAERADQEQHRGDLHDRDTADLVCDASGGHGSGRGTEQRRRDGETEVGVADAEVLLDGVHRTVDDRAVVAEQQTAERGHRRDPDRGLAGREVLVFIEQFRALPGWTTMTGHATTFPAHECVMRITFNHSSLSGGGGSRKWTRLRLGGRESRAGQALRCRTSSSISW